MSHVWRNTLITITEDLKTDEIRAVRGILDDVMDQAWERAEEEIAALGLTVNLRTSTRVENQP